jgi:hypothetical protein
VINLEVRRGQGEPFELDLLAAGVPLPADADEDKLWFTAKRNTTDVDAAAVLSKGTANTGRTGMQFTDVNTGKAELILEPTDTDEITDNVLQYDIQYESAATGLPIMVQWGFVYFLDSITVSDT